MEKREREDETLWEMRFSYDDEEEGREMKKNLLNLKEEQEEDNEIMTARLRALRC